jgi:putative membrane protein
MARILPELFFSLDIEGLNSRVPMPSVACILSRIMLKLFARWFLLAAALLLVATLYPGLEVRGFGAALMAALILGLLNAVVRPLLVVLTLPVTVVTLGLFLFVINAAVFQFAAWMLDGLQVAGFGAALITSLLYSLCGMVIDSALQRLFDED